MDFKIEKRMLPGEVGWIVGLVGRVWDGFHGRDGVVELRGVLVLLSSH